MQGIQAGTHFDIVPARTRFQHIVAVSRNAHWMNDILVQLFKQLCARAFGDARLTFDLDRKNES